MFDGSIWFWNGFWPNLASTLLGVVVGVPIALWLNNLSQQKTSEKNHIDGQTRMREGLEAVLAAFVHNRVRLRILHQYAVEGNASLDVGLDTSAWDATRDQITPTIANPNLVRLISFHFDRQAALSRLSGLYLDTFVGVSNALSGIDGIRAAFREQILLSSKELMDDGDRLQTEIRTVLAPKTAAA